jgi:predicted dehydrogenase
MSRAVPSNRRRFLTRSAAALSAAVAAPYIIPASALGLEDKPPPSDRVVMGCIGTGGKGRNNMGTFLSMPDVQVVAVCDVDARYRAMAKRQVDDKYGNGDCREYLDFRELVARKDINAVSVATPDHWHGLISVAAANEGKDVYCEKPLANSVAEGRAIVEAVKKNDRVLQTGSHERSGDNARAACDLVRAGRIGKLHTIRINLPCDDGHHQEARRMLEMPPESPVPEGFDYDFWLGHTPKVPYHEKRCHFWWRFNLAYGGGEMTDRGAHVIDIGQLGGNFDDTGPVEIEAHGMRNEKSLYNAFWDYIFINTYVNGVNLIGSTAAPRGVKFIGSDGWIFVHIHGQRLEASKKEILDDVQKKIEKNEISLGRSPGHHRNFINCVKTRQQPVAGAEIGHRTASICHLNNIAMILGRKLAWDPQAERFVDDDEASKLLVPVMRPPWKL